MTGGGAWKRLRRMLLMRRRLSLAAAHSAVRPGGDAQTGATRLADTERGMAGQSDELDILARPGANDQVMSKKVLLAVLSCAEAERLGISPDADYVAIIETNFLADLDIRDDQALTQWLTEADLTHDEFRRVMQDFAAVVAVEMHYEPTLAPRVDLHRRLVAARARKLASMA